MPMGRYRQKAHEALQHMDQSADPDVRRMWHDIAEQYEYLAEHVRRSVTGNGQGSPEVPSGSPSPVRGTTGAGP
jgi:hypothetical protein